MDLWFWLLTLVFGGYCLRWCLFLAVRCGVGCWCLSLDLRRLVGCFAY